MELWLLKTEPSVYSFAQLCSDERTRWDGVKNPVALRNLSQMKKGDRLLIYHTGKEKAVVGTATVIGAPYADPKTNNPRLLVVDIAAGALLPRPVSLAEIKANPKFHGWDLLRLPRLSVLAVTPAQWAEIEHLARK